MSIINIEIGAQKPIAILAIIKYVLEDSALVFSVIFNDERASDLNYVQIDIEESELLMEFEQGKIISVMIRCSETRYALINRPRFLSKFSHWYGFIEIRASKERKIVEELLGFDDINFVSVSFEDIVDLDEHELVTPDNFPWNHWRLIEAAVKGGGNTWERRHGPSAQNGGSDSRAS